MSFPSIRPLTTSATPPGGPTIESNTQAAANLSPNDALCNEVQARVDAAIERNALLQSFKSSTSDVQKAVCQNIMTAYQELVSTAKDIIQKSKDGNFHIDDPISSVHEGDKNFLICLVRSRD